MPWWRSTAAFALVYCASVRSTSSFHRMFLASPSMFHPNPSPAVFKVMAQELSSILRHKQKPIIFLINNDGYTIERLILGETARFNDVQSWHYAKLCSVFGDSADFDSRRVSTVGE